MRSWDNYFDESGLLCTYQNGEYDGGDSCQKMGLYRLGRYIKYKNNPEQLAREQAKYAQELDMLECPTRKGWYIRSPSLGRKWWSNPYCFSRDQHRSLVMAMGALKQRKRLLRLIWEHFKRGGFYQNIQTLEGNTQFPDVMAPDHAGEMVRALYMAGFKFVLLLYPLLLIADLSALIGLLLSFPHWKNNPDSGDEDNAIMSHIQARLSLPTPISYLNRKIYFNMMPIMGFTDETKLVALRDTNTTISGPESALLWKHRIATGAPPFAELYSPIIQKYLK
jgi:hypothetical protein